MSKAEMSDTLPTDPVVNTLTDGYRALGCIGKRVLLAVSGGADSLALLLGTQQIAEQLELSVVIASLDHGLRPEAGEEIQAIRSLSERLGLPFQTRALHIAPGPGLEERARTRRYEALESLRLALSCEFTATAHTANDQAETLLMRLARGSVLRGASGILSQRGRVIRPLLRATRAQVEDFIARKGVIPVRDPMNTDRTFFRTRVRLDVLPAFESAAQVPLTQKLAGFAESAAEDERFLDELATLAYERVCLEEGVLDAVGFRALPPALQTRALAKLMEKQGLAVDRATIHTAIRALEGGGRTTLPRGLTLHSSSGLIRCVEMHPSPRRFSVTIGDTPLWRSINEAGLRFRVADRSGGFLTCRLPREARFPLTVRTRSAGDKLLNPRGPNQKLQDWLVDHRVPREFRDELPIVVDQSGHVIWIPGVWSSWEALLGDQWVCAELLEGGTEPAWLSRVTALPWL